MEDQKFTDADLEIVPLPEREAMGKVLSNNHGHINVNGNKGFIKAIVDILSL